MLFIVSYWWLWIILTVISLCATAITFLLGYESDKAKIACVIFVPVSIIGIVISVVSTILAIIQFIKS